MSALLARLDQLVQFDPATELPDLPDLTVCRTRRPAAQDAPLAR